MESYSEVWSLAKEYCRGKCSETIYNLWIDPLTMKSFKDNKIELLTSEFKANIVKSKFLGLLSEALEKTMGFPVEIEIISQSVSKKEDIEIKEKNIQENLNKYDFTFDTFIVGSSNKFAYAASQAVAATPGQAYNPLFIYGNSGLGKTHLLNAICTEIKKNNPDAKIIYTGGEDFTNELILSIEKKTMPDFHNKYRTIDVLLVDDIQFIAGKASTQEEFFHTFNHIHGAGGQIIISSDKPPKDIETLEARLRTRFEWGLIADISSPDYETRMAILRKKEELDGLERYHIPDEVLQYIATNVKSNIRELEGSLNKLIALAVLEKKPIDIALAAEALKDIISPDQNRVVTPGLIMNVVSEHFNVSISDLKGKKRNSEIVLPRQVFMYLCNELTDEPLKSIGIELGGKDHSTVSHGVQKIESLLQEDEALNNTVNIIKKKINPI